MRNEPSVPPSDRIEDVSMVKKGTWMKGLELVRSVSELISEERYSEAEQLLLGAKGKATAESDVPEQDLIISELIALYCISEPKQLRKAEELALERETLRDDPASRLQTAMLLYHSIHSYERTVCKAQEAINLGKIQDDYSVVYSSLSLLGQSLLKLGRAPEALTAFGEMEAIVAAERRFVIGDEISFLEALREQHLEDDRVATLASALAPKCRNNVFRKRLEDLAAGGPGAHP